MNKIGLLPVVLAILFCFHSTSSMTIAKRQFNVDAADRPMCGQITPCGWGVYVSDTRQIDYFVRNVCQCDRPRERCLRTGDDVSVSAYVYRCVRSRAPVALPQTASASLASDQSSTGENRL